MLKVIHDPAGPNSVGASMLDEIVRDGAQQMLAAALHAEVAAYVEVHHDYVDDDGRRLVVRNGYHQAREVTTVASLKVGDHAAAGTKDQPFLRAAAGGQPKERRTQGVNDWYRPPPTPPWSPSSPDRRDRGRSAGRRESVLCPDRCHQRGGQTPH